jgi:hypothetical protein
MKTLRDKASALAATTVSGIGLTVLATPASLAESAIVFVIGALLGSVFYRLTALSWVRTGLRRAAFVPIRQRPVRRGASRPSGGSRHYER